MTVILVGYRNAQAVTYLLTKPHNNNINTNIQWLGLPQGH